MTLFNVNYYKKPAYVLSTQINYDVKAPLLFKIQCLLQEIGLFIGVVDIVI